MCLARCVISQSLVSVGKARKERCACVSLYCQLFNSSFSASIHSFLVFYLTKLGRDSDSEVSFVFIVLVRSRVKKT